MNHGRARSLPVALALLWASVIGATSPIPAAVAASLDLVADPSRWSAHADGPGARIRLGAAARGIAIDVEGDGKSEDYPRLHLAFDFPQDWSGYGRIRARVRLTCADPGIRTKDIAFVFYDDHARVSGAPNSPMKQQGIRHSRAPGEWIDLDDSIAGIDRSAIRAVDIYLYELPLGPSHAYRWEIDGLDLIGPEHGMAILDGCSLAMDTGGPGPPAASVHSNDQLILQIDRQGRVAQIRSGDRILGKGGRVPTGLLVRDAAGDDPAVAVGGTVTQAGEDIRQTSRVEPLGLQVDASFHDAGGYIEISGSVADILGKDRAVTLYFALPTIDDLWEWWDSPSASRSGGGVELAALEGGMDYGLGGEHSKYPLGAISLADRDGLTLAIRMDEPVVHRIGYDPKSRLFYIAFDFGLVNEPRVAGGPLSVAPFRILVYRHDPQWGFRSALERYYGFFPDFFTQRVTKQGGWYAFGNMSATQGALDQGFAFHWGPHDAEAVKWDNANGPLALFYVEAEAFIESFEDFDHRPTREEAVARLQALANADPGVTSAVAALPYRVYPLQTGGEIPAGLAESARTVLASLLHGPDGNPYSVIDAFDWMSRSRWGALFQCNLSPSIPGGQGDFVSTKIIAPGLQQMEEAGGHYDGIALDGSGGYDQFKRADYRREAFPYSPYPLSFSATTHAPVIVAPFSTVAWMRELAARMHPKGRILMANCSWATTPGWLTFAAPYLDVFGAEASHFDDPDFIRAIAYRKACVDLPSSRPPAWELPRHLLNDIYPGVGNDPLALRRYESLLRDLASAGWEPVTGARVTPPGLRLERYGAGGRGSVFLIVHNPGNEAQTVQVDLDLARLALDRGVLTAAAVPADREIELRGSRLLLHADPLETVAIRLSTSSR